MAGLATQGDRPVAVVLGILIDQQKLEKACILVGWVERMRNPTSPVRAEFQRSQPNHLR
jgi:hypothetical protein